MLTREEIEQSLNRVPVETFAAIALRAALRVLPLLAAYPATRDGAPFSVWHAQERSQHLLAILLAQNAALLRILGHGSAALIEQHLTDTALAATRAANTALVSTDHASADSAVSGAALAAAAAHASHAAHAAVMVCAHPTEMHRALDCMTAAQAAVSAYLYAGQDDAAGMAEAFVAAIRQDISMAVAANSSQYLLALGLWPMPNHSWGQAIERFRLDLLSLDPGFTVWLDWYDARLVGSTIDPALLVQWNEVPQAIRAQGTAAINAYLARVMDHQALQPLNRVRAIFLGYGEAGKTSLIRALHDEPVVAAYEANTPSISIRQWNVPQSSISAYLWDFGGQVMVHATHQLFLRESCLYVVVLSARAEINATEQAEYWLEHVKTFGGDAPVMLVSNRLDQAVLNLDMELLNQKYPNVVGYYPLSCIGARTTFQSHFERFRNDFSHQLRLLGTHQVMFTREQFLVLQSLQLASNRAPFLPRAEFDALCERFGVEASEPHSKDWLLDVLDKLGIIIQFPNSQWQEILLNPRWLTYGIYCVLYAQKSHLSIKDVIQIFGKQSVIDEDGRALSFPPEKCRLLMDVMVQFKLAYPGTDNADVFIIPGLLPDVKPAFVFEDTDALIFEYDFVSFVPRQIMPEWIVLRHQEIESNLVWRYGAVLKSATMAARALLEVDYHLRRIILKVVGQAAREYLVLLRDEIGRILARFSLEFQELIVLPLRASVSGSVIETAKAPYRQILGMAKKGIQRYVSASGAQYDLGMVFNVFLDLGGATEHKTAPELSDMVAQLSREIQALAEKVPPEQCDQAADMLRDLENLQAEVQRGPSRKKHVRFLLDSISDAAAVLGAPGKSVLDVTQRLAALLN